MLLAALVRVEVLGGLVQLVAPVAGDRGAALSDFAKPIFAEKLATFPVDEVRIRRFGDTAVIHAQNDYTRKDGTRGVSRYTDIWQKRDGRWVCIAAHITPLPVER